MILLTISFVEGVTVPSVDVADEIWNNAMTGWAPGIIYFWKNFSKFHERAQGELIFFETSKIL